MTHAEKMAEYKARIKRLFPEGWFGSMQVKIPRKALVELATEGFLDSSCASRSSNQYYFRWLGND